MNAGHEGGFPLACGRGGEGLRRSIEYDGNLQDYRVMVTWQPKRWLGIGLGYNQFSVDVDVDGNRFNGSLDWKYRGPMLSYSAVF